MLNDVKGLKAALDMNELEFVEIEARQTVLRARDRWSLLNQWCEQNGAARPQAGAAPQMVDQPHAAPEIAASATDEQSSGAILNRLFTGSMRKAS